MGRDKDFYLLEKRKLENTLSLNYEIINDNEVKILYLNKDIKSADDDLYRLALQADIEMLKAQKAEAEIRVKEMLARLDEINSELEHSK